MKTRFNGFDIICALAELRELVGYRVNQIYDVDNKTYLIKLHHNEERRTLLFESGVRMHTTNFNYPKSNSPSGFTRKLRKHLKNKRLEEIKQVGIDRIIQLQFGTGVASYFIILELFDKGNVILCDHQLMILNVLRPHTEGHDEFRFVVKEIYPISNRARQDDGSPSFSTLKEKIKQAHAGYTLREILNPILFCGSALIDHVLTIHNLSDCKIPGEVKTVEGDKKKKRKNKKEQLANFRDFDIEKDFNLLVNAINDLHGIINTARDKVSKGFIIQKKDIKPKLNGGEEYFFTNLEFHPFPYRQFEKEHIKEFPTFLQAVDDFFSTLEGQKIDLKTLEKEKEALKKLSNIREDHAKRLNELTMNQRIDHEKAELIIRNQYLVESSIHAIQSLLAKQLSWTDIEAFIKERQDNQDKLAMVIKKLKFYSNEITLHLTDPYTIDENEMNNSDDELEEGELIRSEEKLQSMDVDVDLSLSAFANATKYYEMKRSAAKKEQKTIEASGKALKSAEKRTHQTLKDVNIQATITKARKNYWFEKFIWFISSENFLVICGRDSQQNELLVKKYLRPNDIYVHAEIQGASSVIIKNPSGIEVTPKTLNEAGNAAACYSVAWDAKVVTSTYWVYANQVSKTAPSGEYLTTGSFMIRGKKNFLPPCHLILGLSFLFKLEDSSVERHKGERKVRKLEDDLASIATEEDHEIDIESSDESESQEELLKEVEKKLEIIEENSSDFPDTQIKFEHSTGKIDIVKDVKSQQNVSDDGQQEEEEGTIIHAGSMRTKKVEYKLKPQKKQKHQPVPEKKKDSEKGENVPKRGQKGKLKKIKEKYKDQDEEDRALFMDLLKSSGAKSNQKTKNQDTSESEQVISDAKLPHKIQFKEKNIDEIDDINVNDEVDMLDTLTGCPTEEDELLFAIPIVAPYQTLNNYKFKVKLTPGTGRRGKASKTALQMFLRDKNTSTREKDLMKAVKEDIIARNIPGKVKISTPNLQKLKK